MSSLRDGWKDTRGAVMVMGVVFAALLVGVLWHLVGVGDAIIYRERMQEAADATAYESAVWHARTMNLLVALNLIMSAILAVLVAYRLWEMIVAIAGTVALLLSFIPGLTFLGAAAQAAFRYEVRLMEKDPKVVAWVDKWLIRVNKTEKMVSTWAPLIDVGQPSLANTAYYGASGASVDLTFPASLSLLPSIESMAQGAYFPPRMNMGTALPAMPVQEEGYWKLCQKAGEFIPTQIGAILQRLHAGQIGQAVTRLGGHLGEVTGSFPGFFCTNVAQKDTIDKIIDEAATKKCDSDQQQHDADTTSSGEFDMKKCKDDAKKDLKFEKNQVSNKPAKVWDIARNGGLFFQVWSFSHGSPRWSHSDDAGVVLANGESGASGLGDQSEHHWALAEAEYYYDSDTEHEQWHSSQSNAMWNIRWKARLRRVHDPVSLFDGAAFVTGWLTNGINKYLTDTIKAPITAPGLNWLKQNAFDTYLTNTLFKNQVRDELQYVTYGEAGMDSWGTWFMSHIQGGGRSTMIH